MNDEQTTVRIRPARRDDVPAITALDEHNTGLAKPDYWADRFDRYGGREGRFFLVAVDRQGQGDVVGFILGEVRAWEFGSPPCGWIFALGVDPDCRLRGIGSLLFEAICERFQANGVDTLRTMLAVDDHLNLSFFRSLGMRGGPFIQLEKRLGAGDDS